MRIFVCVKQVPDTETKLKIKSDSTGIETQGIKWVVNPYDEFAIEEAVKTKGTSADIQVMAISVGPKTRVVDSLRTALAMGADEAVMIDANEELDSLTTAKALAAAIEKEGGADLIFTGKLAIDHNASSVPQMLAELLSIPHTSVVSKFEKSDSTVKVERDIEGGAKEVVEMPLPSLVAANKGLNMPRYASLPGIMKAKKKPVKEYDLNALGVEINKPLKFTGYRLPPEKPPVHMLEGETPEQAKKLVQLLRDEAKVL